MENKLKSLIRLTLRAYKRDILSENDAVSCIYAVCRRHLYNYAYPACMLGFLASYFLFKYYGE